MQSGVLVFDTVTDATETANCAIVHFPLTDDGWGWGAGILVSSETARRLYDSPSAISYAEGAYTVSVGDFAAATRPEGE